MKHWVNLVSAVLYFILFVTTCSTNSTDDGFLNATCNEASDCYVTDDVWLACWYNVHKCKCQNTISSDYYLKWENQQCLMSKYGPCGTKGALAVGCQDKFICVDSQCRDPNDTSAKAVKVTPFVFDESKCSKGDCNFSNDLHLTCNRDANHCECRKVYIADGRDTTWDIRNYDGNKNCSVGRFGPCGTKNGVKIDCHGDGITCVNGMCINANHPISDVSEVCETNKNCKTGLLCSQDSVCIEPFSLPVNKICSTSNECRKGLICQRRAGAGPWSFPFCTQL